MPGVLRCPRAVRVDSVLLAEAVECVQYCIPDDYQQDRHYAGRRIAASGELSYFVSPEVIRDSEDLLLIDFENKDIQVDNDELGVGNATRLMLIGAEEDGSVDVEQLLQECSLVLRKHYQEDHCQVFFPGELSIIFVTITVTTY